ncbi:M28 family metallopeptidase [Cellulomonas fimi]|uniref:Zn-dependent exopeptidase M28 n=1 Tax=Cellulomonas fimi TaxID=1708 RepID=A0A7Y0LW82_CELFI|nr:M20/M25/M40 family metallo-hydrolase [Cellulomonas fimi]NMR19210.1 Zn-dependent exopeptidase M28 [Cellulomonas fimi]
MDLRSKALSELRSLVELGPRFHGTSGISAATDFLRGRLTALGLDVEGHQVRTDGWDPGATALVEVTDPIVRQLTCWPMLWSGASTGQIRATLRPHGVQGLWADSMKWHKFAAVVDGTVVAYLHARDGGPAAPQPLPIGSDESVPHLAIGRIDGLQISEWLADGHEVSVRLSAECAHGGQAVSENLTVTIPGRTDTGGVLVCGHYDTFWNTPGAYDNGSGTIALLLLAEQWMQQPPARPVTITFFTAEEWHLAGSRSMVAAASDEDLDRLDYVINLDGLGRGDFLEVFIGPEAFEETVVDRVRAFAGSTRERLEIISRFPPTYGTDHAAFYAAGVPSMHFTFNDLHRLHQPDDLPNDGIAANIAWTVPLVQELVETLERPSRTPARGISLPF